MWAILERCRTTILSKLPRHTKKPRVRPVLEPCNEITSSHHATQSCRDVLIHPGHPFPCHSAICNDTRTHQKWRAIADEQDQSALKIQIHVRRRRRTRKYTRLGTHDEVRMERRHVNVSKRSGRYQSNAVFEGSPQKAQARTRLKH